jgi:hypothetical protein
MAALVVVEETRSAWELMIALLVASMLRCRMTPSAQAGDLKGLTGGFLICGVTRVRVSPCSPVAVHHVL